MTAELTSEQRVTELLISNEILRPRKICSNTIPRSNLGDFLQNTIEDSPISRYAFIDTNCEWKF